MISKELLSEILPFGDVNFLISYGLSSDGDILLQYKDIDEIVNIYELAHKCKEWAFKNGYWLSVRLYEHNGFNIVVFSHIHSQLQKDLKEINDKSEPEAIFKACQWILDNKENK